MAVLGVLLVAGVLAEVEEVQLPIGIGLDGSTVVALLALVLWGPVLAFGVLIVAMLGKCVWVGARATDVERGGRLAAFRRELWQAGTLGNVASAGWSLLAGGALLSVLGPGSAHQGVGEAFVAAGEIFLAGVVASAVQLAVGPLIHWPLWYERPLDSTLRSIRGGVPVELAMILLGAVTTTCTLYLGPLSLMLLAPIVVLPLLLPDPARAKSAADLSVSAATHVFAEAIAVNMRLPRATRRRLPAVLGLLAEIRTSGLLGRVEGSETLDPRTLKLLTRAHAGAFEAWSANEHWDGSGPAGLSSAELPPLGQIIAVAQGWAKLTASESPRLAHCEAFTQLRAASGTRYDPEVLRAAEDVVEIERRITPVAACQPRLHRRRQRLRLYLPCVARGATA